MTPRERELREAFAALNAGDLRPFERLFTPDARWHGIEHSGADGETPT